MIDMLDALREKTIGKSGAEEDTLVIESRQSELLHGNDQARQQTAMQEKVKSRRKMAGSKSPTAKTSLWRRARRARTQLRVRTACVSSKFGP